MTEIDWIRSLPVNPLPQLISQADLALMYWIKRDLLNAAGEPVEFLWEAKPALKLLDKQQKNGSWRYPNKSNDPDTGTNYDLLETFRSLGVLIEKFAFNRSHPGIQIAAENVFTQQTPQGDIRGILGNQYMPYYHGAIVELLIKAGYDNDPRIHKSLDWLLAMRQVDGAWIVPAQAVPSKQRTSQFWLGAPVPPVRSKPFSHLATGMVLRAFAAHPAFRQHPAVLKAANNLKTRFFQADKYNDRKNPSYWLKFQFPFWWTNLLTSLDTLARLEINRGDIDIMRGLDWFLTNQAPDGLWETGYGSGKGAASNRAWVGLAVCRVLKYFYQE